MPAIAYSVVSPQRPLHFFRSGPLFGGAYPEAILRTAASALRGSGPQMLVTAASVDAKSRHRAIELNDLTGCGSVDPRADAAILVAERERVATE